MSSFIIMAQDYNGNPNVVLQVDRASPDHIDFLCGTEKHLLQTGNYGLVTEQHPPLLKHRPCCSSLSLH